MKRRLGCLSGSGLLTALAVVLVVVGILWLWGGAMFSPGPLNAQTGNAPLGDITAHADLSNRCDTCHGLPWSGQEMSDLCVDCHTEITAELADAASLHGAMYATEFIHCWECHTEHKGPDAVLTVVDPDRFPHTIATGYALDAHHQPSAADPLACEDCHTDTLTTFDAAVCDTCHRDLDAAFTQTHLAAFGPDCVACHDGLDTYGAAWSHSQTDFPLEGAHTGADCAGCHQAQTTLVALQSTDPACIACHAADDAHNGSYGSDCATCHTAATWAESTFNHALTAFPLTGGHETVQCEQCHVDQLFAGTPTACYGCHQADDVHGGGLGQQCADCHISASWTQTLFTHALTDFPLLGAHSSVACIDCHVDNVFDTTATDCYGCHQADDVHGGGLGQQCEQCHTTAVWTETLFSHALTNFPLTGAHGPVPCEQCHVDNVFAGTPTDCYGCHAAADAHNGEFGQQCEQCHTTATWEDATFDHNLTAFPLTGAHQQTACEQCHANNVFAGTPTDCYGCHAAADAHNGQFGRECDACHTTTAWEPASYNGPHTFPMNHGARENSPCATCHPDSLTTYTCYGCHEHTPQNIAGEHLEEGIRDFEDCVACHADGREHDD